MKDPGSPSCSVVVAEYNNGRYFQELFNSLVSQDVQDFEVIIVDDQSTDDTVARVEQVIKADDRFKLVRHTRNQGTGAAFNTALKHAKGEIVIMLGAEDAMCEGGLRTIIAAHHQHPEASLINFPLYHCDENLKITGQSDLHKKRSDKEYFYWISRGADTFKRSFYSKTDGFDVNLRSAVDQDICFKLEEAGDALFVDIPVYLYRRNAKGISQEANYFPSNLNYFTAVFNAYERRKKSGFKNISVSKFRETKVEHLYWKAFVYDRQRNYFQTALYLLFGYLLGKFYGVRVSEKIRAEIKYSVNHILRRNMFVAMFLGDKK